MNFLPSHIHIKPNAKPVAWHTPVHTPIQWTKIIKESLDYDLNGVVNGCDIQETWDPTKKMSIFNT